MLVRLLIGLVLMQVPVTSMPAMARAGAALADGSSSESTSAQPSEPQEQDPERTIRGNAIGTDRWATLVATGAANVATEAAAAMSEALSEISDQTQGSGANAATTPREPLTASQIQCTSRIMDPQPPAGDPKWEGNDPSEGSVLFNDCSGRTEYEFMPGPNPIASNLPLPPTAEELADRAYKEIYVAPPKIGAGPDRTRLAVNLWTWLWIDDPGPQSITVASGGVSVTATATLTSVTWTLGEPPVTGGPYASGPPVSITCQGIGTPPKANYDWKAEPPCGHKYTWMSTKERTGGTGKWPIIATSNWTVNWQSNTGVSGSGTLSATSNDALEIGEYRTVLVQGPGG